MRARPERKVGMKDRDRQQRWVLRVPLTLAMTVDRVGSHTQSCCPGEGLRGVRHGGAGTLLCLLPCPMSLSPPAETSHMACLFSWSCPQARFSMVDAVPTEAG